MNLSSRLYWTLRVQKLLAADNHSDSGWYWSISCRLIGQGFVLVASFGSSVIPLCVVWAQRCFRAGMKVLVFSFFVSSVRTCGTSWWSMENLGVRSLGPLPSLTGEWSSTLSLQMLLNLLFLFSFFSFRFFIFSRFEIFWFVYRAPRPWGPDESREEIMCRGFSFSSVCITLLVQLFIFWFLEAWFLVFIVCP